MWNLEKNGTDELICKTGKGTQHRVQTYGHEREKRGWEKQSSMEIYTLPCAKQRAHKKLPYSMGSSA